MSLVQTTKGLIDDSVLVVKDIVENHENARVVATEWFLGDELVRRDVNVNVLRGVELCGEQNQIGG
jgi:hypothetical protein